MRYTPLRKVGKRGKEIQAIRAKAWLSVLWKAGYKCEGCDTPASKTTLTWSHAFGRNGTGAGLGEWAHVPELAFALCVTVRDRFGGCHRRYDDCLDAPLRRRLEKRALDRFQKKYGGKIRVTWAPMDNIREMVRVLEAAGQTPNAA